MQKRSKSKREMELEAKEIRAATGEPRLYYPGGAQGGGSTRKKSGSPVVRPHVKTHSRCKDCGLFHTPEQHEAHSAWKGGAASAGPRAASGPVARSGAKAQGRRAKTSALPTALPSRSAASLDTAELVDPTALPSGSAASLDTAELVAKAVHQVAPKIKQSQRGGKWRGRIGVNVFIDAVWRLLHKPRFSKKTLDWFKRVLVEANQRQLLELTRLDLTDIADYQSIRDSEISHLGATFHLIVDREAAKKRDDPYGFLA